MRKVLTVLICLAAPTAAFAQGAVRGVVRDATGAVVSGAAVLVQTPAGVEQRGVTGPEGRFETARGVPDGSTLIVRAGGFAESRQPVSGGTEVEVVLEPATLFESVTVTPTRMEQRLGDVPASVNVIDKETIRHSPALVADDVLRLVPTFSLFRRTSSLSAHPTAQGVSLRGIGPSGVSRSLVLMDGVPFNDPFGGWVYWTRVPLESVERVEIVDGTSSSVYGNYAMGGVINVVTARPRPRTFELRSQVGNRDTRTADVLASDVWGRVGASIEASLFDTGGFPIVAASERGPVDTDASVEYRNFAVKLDYTPIDRVSTFIRGGYFREERINGKFSTFDGTPEANDTLWKSVSGGVRATLPDDSDLQARLFLDFERFHSTFLAVPNLQTRAIGRMSLRQRIPTTGVGGMVQWSKARSTRQLFTIGTDWRHVEGASHEQVLDFARGLTPVTRRESGGTQLSSGVYGQGQFWPTPQLSLTVSGRVDHWRNYDARHLESSIATGQPTANDRGALPEKDDTVFSPRAAVLYHVNDRVTTWGSLGSGFRAPTLNELYRQFRVGALLTLANEQLGPERLVGGELGINIAPIRDLTVRTTFFDNRVKNPVSNVTLVPNAVQQRQNLGRTRIWGIQSDVEHRFARDWRVGAAYMFNQAKVSENPDAPALVGNYLPQVPTHRGSVNVSYSNPQYATVLVNAFFFGRQFDDDRNLRTKPGETEPGLPGYGMIELSATRAITDNLDLFVAVQNLFDTEYYVGLSPTTIGTPRLVNGGIRVRFSGR